MYVPPRINWQSVWHKLNAGSLEDQRTSLMSDADDFLNPFSSVCVCVCVRVCFLFLFLFWEVKWVHPKSSSFNFLKELWILWQQLNNNNVTKSMKLQNHFLKTFTYNSNWNAKKKGFRTLLLLWGNFFLNLVWTFFLNLVSLTFGRNPSKESIWYTFYIFLDQFVSTLVPRLVWQQARCLTIIIIFLSFAFSS
jgi:hypothetical protein